MATSVDVMRELGKTNDSLVKVIEVISQGLPMSALNDLAEAYGITQQAMADLVGIRARTLQRRREAGLLSAQESERLYRYIRLYRRTLEVFDNDVESARDFLSTPQPGLEGQVPRDFARSELGADAAMDLLGRIEHGVYT